MINNIAKSIKGKLLNIAKTNGINYQQLIIRYLFERLLYRLSLSRYRDKFCLKGGVLLYALEKDMLRPTLDIDFLGIKIKNDIETIQDAFSKILSLYSNDGVLFDISTVKAENINESNVYQGIRVAFTAKLDSIRQSMKIDIGFGDIVVPTAQNLLYPVLMDELPAPDILAYSLESVVAEKFQAMIELSELNSRYKDFYDVYKILSIQKLDVVLLKEAIHATFKNRSTSYMETHPLFSESFRNDERRNAQWNNFLKKIKYNGHLEFKDVMSLVTLNLQPIYEKLKPV